VIVDSELSVKGDRYEIWCKGREVGVKVRLDEERRKAGRRAGRRAGGGGLERNNTGISPATIANNLPFVASLIAVCLGLHWLRDRGSGVNGEQWKCGKVHPRDFGFLSFEFSIHHRGATSSLWF